MSQRIVIAIDGPAGAGKSTVCRLLARELGYVYLDTGAMYRAVAWALMEEGIGLEEESRIAGRLPELPLGFAVEKGALSISYGDRALDEELRPPEITRRASRVSQIASVRVLLTEWQRRLGAGGGIVAEGRDMATVVFPDAAVKVFLTADLATRAQRRQAEYAKKGIVLDYETLERQILERDRADQERALSPLKAAEGAHVLDTSELDIAQVVGRLLEHVWEAEKDGDNIA